MKAYILRALIRALITMFFVATLVFIFLRLSPIDPAHTMLGEYATPDRVQIIRHTMGLDRPIFIQYFQFISDLIKGDLGYSYINKQAILPQILSVLPYTLELLMSGIVLGILFGVPLGIIAALKPNGFIDQAIRIFTLVGISIPVFISGIFLIIIFCLNLEWLPITARHGSGLQPRLLVLILPSFSVAFRMMASVTRLMRSSLLDVLKQWYITTARSKGLKERVVILVHALRNALLPLVTYLGISVNILLGSAVLSEMVFMRPGIGRLIVESIIGGDFPIVQVMIMFYAGIVVIVNLVVDITYSFLDPRIVYK